MYTCDSFAPGSEYCHNKRERDKKRDLFFWIHPNSVLDNYLKNPENGAGYSLIPVNISDLF